MVPLGRAFRTKLSSREGTSFLSKSFLASKVCAVQQINATSKTSESVLKRAMRSFEAICERLKLGKMESRNKEDSRREVCVANLGGV